MGTPHTQWERHTPNGNAPPHPISGRNARVAPLLGAFLDTPNGKTSPNENATQNQQERPRYPVVRGVLAQPHLERPEIPMIIGFGTPLTIG